MLTRTCKSYRRWLNRKGLEDHLPSRLKWVLNCVVYSNNPELCEHIHQEAINNKWRIKIVHQPFTLEVPVPHGCPAGAIYDRYKNQSRMGFPPQYLIEIPEARCYGGGFVRLPDGRFMIESAWRLGALQESEYYRKWWHRHKKKLRGDFYNLTSFWGKNYGHWLYEDLPRLVNALPDLPAEISFLVPSDIEGWQVDSLRALGISARQLVRVNGFEEVHCERLWFSTELGSSKDFCTSPTTVAEVRRLMLHQLRPHQDRSLRPEGGSSRKKLFVMRRGVQKRRLSNEDDLGSVAERLGFQLISPERLTLSEQIRQFTDAEVVVGAFGAALTNVLFSGPDSVLVELQDDSSFGCPRTWYWKMAHVFRVQYRTIVGSTTKFNNWDDVEFEVDPSFFEEKISEICSALNDPQSQSAHFFHRDRADLTI